MKGVKLKSGVKSWCDRGWDSKKRYEANSKQSDWEILLSKRARRDDWG